MAKKFYKTIFTFEVLSEEPLDDSMSLEKLQYECEEGIFVGRFGDTQQIELTPKEAAKALNDFGSQPEFFELDEDGNEIDS